LVGFREEALETLGVAPWLVKGVWYSLASEADTEAGVGAVDESRLSARLDSEPTAGNVELLPAAASDLLVCTIALPKTSRSLG